MAKRLKFLLLASIVLFAALVNVARADDDDDDNKREKDLGDGDRSCGDVSGSGYRGIKLTRTSTTGTDTVVFSFRAFPVPRVRVRYFDGEVSDNEIEDNDLEEKIELVAAIPGYFLFSQPTTDTDPTYNPTTDTITQRFNLRRSNGNAWATPVLNVTDTDGVRVYKVTVCRKVKDFCFVSYVANGTAEYDGYTLGADSVKFNIEITPGTTLEIADNERLAVVVKVHYKSDLSVEDNSEENEELVSAGATLTQNDVLIGSASDAVSAFFNWEKTVDVAYSDGTTQVLNIVSSVLTNLDFDKRSSSAGVTSSDSDSDDEDEDEDETEEERASEDERDSYSDDEEDNAVRGRLGNTIFVFSINGSLETATKIVWDPSSGATPLSVSTAVSDAARGLSMTFATVIIAAVAVSALFLY